MAKPRSLSRSHDSHLRKPLPAALSLSLSYLHESRPWQPGSLTVAPPQVTTSSFFQIARNRSVHQQAPTLCSRLLRDFALNISLSLCLHHSVNQHGSTHSLAVHAFKHLRDCKLQGASIQKLYLRLFPYLF